jgi:aminopeptidase N
MKKLFLSLAVIFCCLSPFAFSIPPMHPHPDMMRMAFDAKNPNQEYRSPMNPFYWKNRKPFETYWQQDIHYTIKANIDEVNDIIIGDEELMYVNNSPDTLHEVYFHLYQNAFQPNSYLDDLNKANNVKTKWGKYEAKGLGTELMNVSVNGNVVSFEQDFTVVKIKLSNPLPPNSSTIFSMKFKTYWDNGSQRRRMKKFDEVGHKDEAGYRHYDGVHWYPRMCVYDAKFGWDVQQHMGKEFYGDYGSFDVELTFSNNYVVEATGWLQNENEVLPTDLRKQLDIKNFIDKKPISTKQNKPSEIIPYISANRKTWKYHATNVHDFAFTADPSYRIGEAEWNGVKIVSLVQESHAAGWKNAADYTAKVIEYYSNRVGMYAYPKMVVADAQDGMEYPMLTLDGGTDPGYRDLLAHEVGHNWFFGMVGNNETYRAMLDEGFTQFLNTNACEAIDGKYRIQPKSKSAYVNRFKQKDLIRSSETYNGYMGEAIRESSATLNTHSDDFAGALNHDGGYRNVYFKTSTMLFNLQYTLGDSLFWKAFSNYFNQWKMCHPYPEDFRNSIHQSTKVDLNWFFDEWMETSKTIDYEIRNVKKIDAGKYQITLRRNGEMQMPIDIRVLNKQGKAFDYHIPNTWFVKNTNATVLPKWWGWGKFRKTYTFEANIGGKLKDVIIDTSLRLADNDMRNNTWKDNSKWLFDSQINQPTDWTREVCKWRPELWWNGVDGMKLGLHVNGNYMNYKHSFSATVWYNTRLGNNVGLTDYVKTNKDGLSIYNKINFNIEAQRATDKFMKGSSIQAQARILDGLSLVKFQFNIQANAKNKFFINYKTMQQFDKRYLFNANDWGYENYLSDSRLSRNVFDVDANGRLINSYSNTIREIEKNMNINGGWEHNYGYYKGTGKILLEGRVGSNSQDSIHWHPYSYLQMTVTNTIRVKKFDIRTRAYGRISSGMLPNESALYLAGASPEEMAENKFTRSVGYVPNDWMRYQSSTSNFQMGGGLNLRGYAGYLAIEQFANTNYQYFTHKGRSGFSGSVEVDFDDYIKCTPKFFRNWLHVDGYAFADGGAIIYDDSLNNTIIGDYTGAFRMDAGLGTAWTIKRWGKLDAIKPITIRFDMPLFLNRPPFGESYFKFRWVLGVSRSF